MPIRTLILGFSSVYVWEKKKAAPLSASARSLGCLTWIGPLFYGRSTNPPLGEERLLTVTGGVAFAPLLKGRYKLYHLEIKVSGFGDISSWMDVCVSGGCGDPAYAVLNDELPIVVFRELAAPRGVGGKKRGYSMFYLSS